MLVVLALSLSKKAARAFKKDTWDSFSFWIKGNFFSIKPNAYLIKVSTSVDSWAKIWLTSSADLAWPI